MDGVFADFASAYREVEERLFGAAAPRTRAGDPEEEAGAPEEDGEDVRGVDEQRRRRDVIWRSIQSTLDFWTTLRPLDPGAVARLHALALQHKWEVFFITQRPATEGQAVQRQTQQWLVAHGFDLPSVLVLQGSRGAAAAALRLDYHVDDNALHCIDVKSESGAKPILIVEANDVATVNGARRLGIGTAVSVGECLGILDQAARARAQPGLLHRLAKLVGWQ